MSLIIASATRQPDQTAFMLGTPLGKSLQKLSALVEFKVSLACNRTDGLPKFYNEVIDASSPEDVFCFVHDDYAIMDNFFAEKLTAAFKEYGVIGVAGCRTPPDKLPVRWHHPDHEPSGTIGNSTTKENFLASQMISFGPSPARTVALDGVFMATCKKALDVSDNLRFDEQFKYHHYDVDFGYTAAHRGLICGTWPIYGCHCSCEGDGYNSKQWRDRAEIFREKWARFYAEKAKEGAA